MLDKYKILVESSYGITATKVDKAKGGWAADAYIIHTAEEKFFLKSYDKKRKSIETWIEKIDGYIPILVLLSEHSKLSKHVPKLHATLDGTYKVEDKDEVILLFSYIEGETIGENSLSKNQIKDLAYIISELHNFTHMIPSFEYFPHENLTLSSCINLKSYLDNINDTPEELQNILMTYAQQLDHLLDVTSRLLDEERNYNSDLVLCHTDAHNWNLMQSDYLILLDWEGVCIAPPEADLFIFYEEDFFEDFISQYKEARSNYTINYRMIFYYIFKRKLNDIYEFIVQILHDSSDPKIIEDAYIHLINECASLERVFADYKNSLT